MQYETSKVPWECVCNQTRYAQAGDQCIVLADAQTITGNYPVNTAKSLILNHAEVILILLNRHQIH